MFWLIALAVSLPFASKLSSILTGRYRLDCQEAAARCVELQRNYPEGLSDDVNFNQAALRLPRKLAAVTRMEGEKEAMQRQALLFSSKGSASPCHPCAGYLEYPFQKNGATMALHARRAGLAARSPQGLTWTFEPVLATWYIHSLIRCSRQPAVYIFILSNQLIIQGTKEIWSEV